ncbi:MAG: hypothetical protein HY850_05495 [Betaproteobacteria bacterium]|nr:hypothetical protein [Betaproteobacteria bacterium]
MEISSQVTNYSALNQTQNLGGNHIVAATRAIDARNADNTSAAARNSNTADDQTKQTLLSRQAKIDRPASTTDAYANFSYTRFEYERNREIMSVLSKHDVLIYQIPTKGALEVIKAEYQSHIIEATA